MNKIAKFKLLVKRYEKSTDATVARELALVSLHLLELSI